MKLYVVQEGEEELLIWTLVEGRVFQGGTHLRAWSPHTRKGSLVGLSLYEGSHPEYGDRDEFVYLEDNSAPEFITLNRERAEALVERNRLERLRYERVEALLITHGLDDQSIKEKRAELISAHNLD